MKIRYVSAGLILLALVVFTGVKVSALWPQQEPLTNSPQLGLLNTDMSDAAWSAALTKQQRAMLERLNHRLQSNADDFEASLMKGLLLFQTGRLNAAVVELKDLTRRAPKFQLAHLILGDLLLARFDLVASIGESTLLRQMGAEKSEQIEQLRREAQARLTGYLSLLDDIEVPKALLTLSQDTEYALLVDKSKNRLYVYRNLGPGLPPELIDDYYIVLGKKTGDKFAEGDLRTPNGVYFVTSYLPDEKLPPLYGAGAFPVNYPNEIDRRLQKTGNGIWLHGTDKDFYSRPPLDTEGCVVLTNEEFDRIADYVDIGRTPVVISEQVEWLSSSSWLEQNIEIQSTLEHWRQSWEQADLETYIDLYSRDFWADGYDCKSWQRYKKRVFAGKKYQKIELSDLTLLTYPKVASAGPMVVANFVQHYRSNNYNGDMRKRLYMVKEDGRWKVLYEGRQ